MPEGPEIRRAADRLAGVLTGRRVDSVVFGLPRLESWQEALSGATVRALETRGKALLTHFDNDLTLYSHNQLYGRWYIRPRGQLPATGRSLRVALHTPDHSALLYSASDIEVLDAAGLAAHPFLARVGPDILDPSLTWQAIAARLESIEFRGRALWALYLDQSFLAGVGNYLRSEILFHASVDPGAKPRQLNQRQINRLARSTLSISLRAYQTGGQTNPPGRATALKARGETREKRRFAVFGRNYESCYRCGQTVLRIIAASRRLYWCPRCQAPPAGPEEEVQP